MTRRRTECTLLQRLKLKRLAEELMSDADGLEFVLLSLGDVQALVHVLPHCASMRDLAYTCIVAGEVRR